MSRIIGHLDIDYFFAQVEEIENNELVGKPVVVCVFSGRTSESGVVSTSNYEARKLGIKSGMPIYIAKKKAQGTNAVFLPLNKAKYERYSEKVMGIVQKQVDVFEQVSIDEAFFDITNACNSDFSKATDFGAKIKRDILNETGLKVTIGVGPTKYVAKILSDISKPDGLAVVDDKKARDYISSFSVDALYGIGPKKSVLLKEAGIKTIGELASADLTVLEKILGKKDAIKFYKAARIEDDEEVVERTSGETLQISRIITLKQDTRESEKILTQLESAIHEIISDVVGRRLQFRNVTVIAFLSDLSLKTKSKKLEYSTNDVAVLKNTVKELLNSLCESVEKDIRRAGVRVSDFTFAKEQDTLTRYV